jgi:hypothetical protein
MGWAGSHKLQANRYTISRHLRHLSGLWQHTNITVYAVCARIQGRHTSNVQGVHVFALPDQPTT